MSVMSTTTETRLGVKSENGGRNIRFAIMFFLFLQRQREKTLEEKSGYIQSFQKKKVRREHSQYYNLITELGLGDREHYFK